MTRLPLAGTRQAHDTPDVLGPAIGMPRALVVVPAYESAPVWKALAEVKAPVLRVQLSDEDRREQRSAPMPHEQLMGSASWLKAQLAEHGHCVVLGAVASQLVQGGALVVVAGPVGRHGWSTTIRSIADEETLVLRDPRPGVLTRLMARLG